MLCERFVYSGLEVKGRQVAVAMAVAMLWYRQRRRGSGGCADARNLEQLSLTCAALAAVYC